ncbi:MAG: hypothetical protein QOG90_1787 [Actinomycetota bacterium]|jgi:uncharacterized OsmC-like protein
MTTETKKPVDNGVDLEALVGAREMLGNQPELGDFKWRVSSTWKTGNHTENLVDKFYGLGEEQGHHTSFTYDVDHPEQFSASDVGPTPVEYVLVGLAGCLSAGIANIATLREIQLHSVTAILEADHRLLGTLGIDPEQRPGFDSVSVKYIVEADATPDEIEALVAQSQKRSPVYDMLVNPTSVTVEVNK